MKYIYILLIIFSYYADLLAQGQGNYRRFQGGEVPKEGVVKGKIIEEDSSDPLEYANVILYQLRDSSMVTGAITSAEGTFTIEEVPFGRFYLVANYIGYNKKTIESLKIIPTQKTIDIGTVALSEASTQLDNVEITAERTAVEYHIDKKVVNVSQDLVSSGGSAVNALENVPSVRVDIEGNVSLRGSSNFTVFIDGRPTVLSGSDALQQIPASAIEKIEIITNPSAKYDPDGVGGIINVIMKKQVKPGFNGIINASVGVRDKYTADALVNYKVGKFNLFGGANWNDQTFLMNRDSYSETIFSDRIEIIDSKGDGNMRRQGYDLKAGFDYSINDKQTLSFSGNYGYFGFGRESTSKQATYSNASSDRDYLINKSDALRDGNFYNFNLNFQNKFDDNGHELSFRSNYSYRFGDDKDNTDEYETNSDWEITDPQPFRVFTNENGNSNEFRFQTDYTKPLKNGKLEAGLQYRYDDDNEDFVFEEYNAEQDQWISNEFFNNSNQFKRNIYAGYTTFSNELLGFQYQLGLRGEYTDRTIKTINDDKSPYIIDRLDIFPTFHITKDISKTDQIQGGYSRRINRPRGYYLEPFISYGSRNFYRTGSPELEPEYVNSYELNYQKRFGVSFISVESYFRETVNAFTRTISLFDSTNNIRLLGIQNLNREKFLGGELMVNWEFTDWLRVNASANVYRFDLEGNVSEQEVARQSTNYDLRLNNTISITPNTRLQLIGFYNGPSATAQGERDGFYMVNAALRQDFFSKKLTATLQARDIFGSMKFKINSSQVDPNGPDFNTIFKMQREPRVLTLTLSYKINNYKQERSRRGEDGGGGMDGDFGDDF